MPLGSDKAGTTILVVDGDAANRALAEDALARQGYRVISATRQRDGIEAFTTGTRPDCVLLDATSPDVDGFAVSERIRRLAEGATPAILFFVDQDDREAFDRALRAGADALPKPLRTGELAARVEAALDRRRPRATTHEDYETLKSERDDALRLREQKERLMAFVVHDLKNPVNALDLHAQVLLRERNLSSAARDSAGQIRAEARQLSRMISNLLDLSAADEGRLVPRPAPIDLGGIVVNVIAELEILAANRGVKLTTSLEADKIHADADLLRRTIANLVDNAIRHAPPATTVEVQTLHRVDGVELRVVDGGAGVPREMRERVFDAFVQVEEDGASRTAGGRGLGLTFCKLAVEAHGGRIRVEEGSPGAIFCVSLPSAGRTKD